MEGASLTGSIQSQQNQLKSTKFCITNFVIKKNQRNFIKSVGFIKINFWLNSSVENLCNFILLMMESNVECY